MESLFQSTYLIAISEMGDKTQLLALILATRFKRPLAIMSGILVATLLNHGLSGILGVQLKSYITPETLKWWMTAGFVGFGIWMLIPDKDEGLEQSLEKHSSRGAFLTTFVTFFLAEMGDKTQLATLALAARLPNLPFVIIGTTLGMLISDGIAVYFGEKLTSRVSFKWIRIFAFLSFVAFGILSCKS